MVSTGSQYNFTAVIDDFFALRDFSGRHGPMLAALVRERATSLLSHPDVRYMPAFKILDLLAALVNLAATVAEAPQLRANEARAMMRESIADSTPLIHHFMLEAALERVRYEPLMLAKRASDAAAEREQVLHLRWAAMRAAHQEKAALPEAWMDTIDSAVEHALAAHAFRQFRQGPLLQLFAEMLSTGRKLHQQNMPLAQLASALSENGALWKRYALKTSRFNENPRVPGMVTSALVPSHSVH